MDEWFVWRAGSCDNRRCLVAGKMEEKNKGPLFIDEYVKLHPADLADRLLRLDAAARAELLKNLPSGVTAAAVAELDEEHYQLVTGALSAEHLADIVEEMPHDHAADLLGEMGEERREKVLSALDKEDSAPIEELLKYPEDTAGGIMDDRFFTLPSGSSVAQCLEEIRSKADERKEDISYLYVVDTGERLVGVVPLRELVFSKPSQMVDDIMLRDVKILRVDDDQEEVANQFEHYGYLGLPVLDAGGRMVGIVKATDVIEIAHDEATEDMQLMVGLSGEERSSTPWRTSLRRRLPWLYVNLATAFLAAFVVGMFEDTIKQMTALAVFLPIVAGQGGNAGMQTLTVIIRDMALGELEPGDGRRALFKEVLLGLIHGIAIGIVVGLIAWVWKGKPVFGLVAGLAMVLNQMAAALSGVLIPFSLKMLKIDPAMASSIILTTVTDVAGFFFFLGMAALAMQWLV